MSMIFVDRESAYPNRYRVIPETGEAYYIVLERADEPVTPGTPLNAETFNAMRDEIEASRAPAGLVSDYKSVTTNDGITTAMTSIFQAMGDGTAKIIRLNINANGLNLPGGIWFVTLYRTGTQYGYVEAVTYVGGGQVYTNTVYNSAWTGWKKVFPSANYVGTASVE